MLTATEKIFQDDLSLDAINLAYFARPVDQTTLIEKINLFLKAIEKGENIGDSGLCNALTTLLLEAAIRNGEAALLKHLLLRKFLAEAGNEIITKMGKWYKFKLNAINDKNTQNDLQEKLSNVKNNPAQAKIIRKEFLKNIEKKICENEDFISHFANIGTPQDVLALINRIYNFAHVLRAAQALLCFYTIEVNYEESGEFITIHRQILQTDIAQYIELLTPPEEVTDEEKDEKKSEEKDKDKDKGKKLPQAKEVFRFSFNLTQDELASVLEQVLHEGDSVRFNTFFPHEYGHSVYLRVIRNANGCLEYQLFNSNSSFRFFRIFNSCTELARVLKYALFLEGKIIYMPLDFQVVETVCHPDRPTIEMVLDDLLKKRDNHPNINQKTRGGASALFVAARSGNSAVIDYLLKKGAVIDSASLAKAQDAYIYYKLDRQQSFFSRNWQYMAVAALVGGVCATGIGVICFGLSVAICALAMIGALASAAVAALKKSKDEFNLGIAMLHVKATKEPALGSKRMDVRIKPQSRDKFPKKIRVEMGKAVEMKKAEDIFTNIHIASIGSIKQAKMAVNTMFELIFLNKKQLNEAYKKQHIEILFGFVASLSMDLEKYSRWNLTNVNILKKTLQFVISAYRNILTATSEYAANNYAMDFFDDVTDLVCCAKKSGYRFFVDPLFKQIEFAMVFAFRKSQQMQPPPIEQILLERTQQLNK